ncbi:cytokine receptor common subunit gamma isoform X2 [Mauremys reevesii]|uniref:cytokine receptor common subunit gamma isoform X2 n=1 Tax=Mauremys reevesii TaxID=260615 RepID=UPI00193F643A|nr:cytokine receptor common subunit gamma isoform X2 [Mauremys reevesii]
MDSPLSPSSARKEAGMFLTLIFLLSGRSQRAMAAQRQQGVECIVFNDQYLTCMWGSKEMPTANYSLYYWYISPRPENHMPVECKHYLQEEGINTGCWFNPSEIIQFRTFYIHINASHEGRSLVIPTKAMKLQDLVKPAPPVNLTIQNISNNQLQLTWDSMYNRPHCLEYAVRYKSNKDTRWTEHLASGKIFSFPSVDYEKYYTFYVKSKINQYCGTTQLWSEWSVPVFWGNNATDKESGSFSCPESPTPARTSMSSSTPTRATSRNGPESPRTLWRALIPTTTRASATSVSCPPRREARPSGGAVTSREPPRGAPQPQPPGAALG